MTNYQDARGGSYYTLFWRRLWSSRQGKLHGSPPTLRLQLFPGCRGEGDYERSAASEPGNTAAAYARVRSRGAQTGGRFERSHSHGRIDARLRPRHGSSLTRGYCTARQVDLLAKKARVESKKWRWNDDRRLDGMNTPNLLDIAGLRGGGARRPKLRNSVCRRHDSPVKSSFGKKVGSVPRQRLG